MVDDFQKRMDDMTLKLGDIDQELDKAGEKDDFSNTVTKAYYKCYRCNKKLSALLND